ncbi:acylphosphatase [Salinicoccus roseus]|uniref:ATP-binding protein n=1 Tax=Salinicoccus roseus TaxID=45670 RepID=UPI003DA0739F
MKNKENQLPHLRNALPKDVYNYQISFYTVALEGWRRGLKLKYYNSKRGGRIPSTSITYSLSDESNTHRFVCARGTKSSKAAISKAENKSTAYEYMKKNGVPIPESQTFKLSEISIDEICEHGDSMGYPLVIKPTDKGGGRGVVTHITSKKMLKDSILKVIDEFDVDTLLIEKYFENGVDYRFYVIEDEVIAVTKSYSSNVIGDGRHDIRKLIELRNKDIKNNVATKNRTINIDDEMIDFLKEKNISLDDIPEQGERVFLRKHGTHLGKRLSVECTDTIDPKFKKYAVDALNSIPGLPTGSIDMIINEEKNEGVVNEINTKGEIMMHVFPFEGKAIDVPKKLIDYYFPSSKKINDNFYFEYKPVKDAFMSGYADEMTIPMYPDKQQYKIQMKVKGKNLTSAYLRRLKKAAAKNHLKGFIKAESREALEINVIGSKSKVSDFKKYVENSDGKKSKIYNVDASEISVFEGVSTIGLEVLENDKPKASNNRRQTNNTVSVNKKIDELEAKIQEMSKEYEAEKKRLIKDKESAEAEYNKMRKSTSWRLTRPIRRVKEIIKK